MKAWRRAALGICAVGLCLLAVSCFREKRTVTQKDPVSHVHFTGSTDGAAFRLERDETVLWDWTKVDGGKLYETRPGPCTVLVQRGGAVIVRRSVLLVDGQVTEITVP